MCPGTSMTDDGSISRSVLAEQVKDRLLQDDPRRTVPAGLADRGDPGRAGARDQPGAGPRGAPRARGPRASWRSSRSAGRGSGARPIAELLEAYAVRAELESPRGTARRPDDDGRGPGRARDAARRRCSGPPGPTTGTRSRSRTRRSTPASCSSPATPPSSGSGARSSPSRGPTSRWSPRAPTRDWTAGLHPPILRALQARDAAAVEAALRHHFAEASEHLASGWQEPAATR